ncbi:MAG TPA: TonB-dependent receptor [Candidatus Competibacter sp.]|nr:TonB-dependent receptor [Candidatus Competibacter sp.]HRF64070.1 TonB-dependent receptor [Candidatus Competibacter sp.]
MRSANVLPKWVLWVCLGLMASRVVAVTPDLTQLSIEELMNVQVVSPTKQSQRLADTASAVFVITQDDIRRTGVANVPDALRLAPGVQVARIDANKWAISIRGFNGRFANKLLVLVDGRSIYTPTFSGVYWEIQDLLLEDIERIEVIRGPGASLWGANAVNGVINIITKPAKDTRGLVSVTVGERERPVVGVRFGGQLGDDAHYRLFGKYLNQDGLLDTQGQDAEDDWRLGSGGFRFDWTPSGRDSITLQGDAYDGTWRQNLLVPVLVSPYQQRIRDAVRDSGGSLQGGWERTFSATSNLNLKFYYQRERHTDSLLGLTLDTFDLDLQHTFALNERNAVIWGLGYRYYHDRYPDAQLGTMTPSTLDYDLFSAFLQDQITLIPKTLDFALGARLEHNDFTGWELQPNARLLWTPYPQHHLWAAVSRAVRTPSRADNGIALSLLAIPPETPQNPLPLPGLLIFRGVPAFGSEKLTAYEIGYRNLPSERLSLDITVFYNDYDDLRAVDIRSDLATVADGYVQIPGLFVNAGQGRTYGFETAINWQVEDWWRLQLAYSYLQADLQNKSEFSNAVSVVRNGSQPHHQLSLLSNFNIRRDLEFDLWLYYVDKLSDLIVVSPALTASVDSYFSVNARFGWRPREDLELSLVGTGLLGPSHVEFVQETYPFPEQVDRSIYGQMKWSF